MSWLLIGPESPLPVENTSKDEAKTSWLYLVSLFGLPLLFFFSSIWLWETGRFSGEVENSLPEINTSTRSFTSQPSHSPLSLSDLVDPVIRLIR